MKTEAGGLTVSRAAVREFLVAHADAGYASFSSSLVPGALPMLGVRLPVLRALAREIAAGDWQTYLAEAAGDTFEEVMLQGLVTGMARMPFDEQMGRMAAYVCKITDWALCDSPTMSFKFVRRRRKEVWTFLQPYLYSEGEFTRRFAIVLLLAHFITDDFIDRVLEACVSVSSQGYYVMMARAWLVAECFIKYPERTRSLLAGGALDDATQNKAIQKIVDSFRVPEGDKNWARALRRKATRRK